MSMYKMRKGMKADIFSADKKKRLGIGIYVKSKQINFFGSKIWMPGFKVGKKIIWGYQCWWIPLSEIKRRLKAKSKC